MSLDALAAVTIALMAVLTFGTRAGGYLALRRARPGPRAERFLRVAPQTMFVALVTPALVEGGPAEWLGAAAAIVLMAVTRNLLLSLVAATVTVAVARGL